jgi:hypothetical protein
MTGIKVLLAAILLNLAVLTVVVGFWSQRAARERLEDKAAAAHARVERAEANTKRVLQGR